MIRRWPKIEFSQKSDQVSRCPLHTPQIALELEVVVHMVATWFHGQGQPFPGWTALGQLWAPCQMYPFGRASGKHSGADPNGPSDWDQWEVFLEESIEFLLEVLKNIVNQLFICWNENLNKRPINCMLALMFLTHAFKVLHDLNSHVCVLIHSWRQGPSWYKNYFYKIYNSKSRPINSYRYAFLGVLLGLFLASSLENRP